MENLNSVCFVDEIIEITPIEGADKIVSCKVNGWSSIIGKDVHKVGDKVLCFTTDAVIPQDLVDDLNIGNYLRKGNRVRTVKLRGVYSECIVVPAEAVINDWGNVVLGADFMKIFGVFKYEPPVRQVQGPGKQKHKYRDNPNFHVYYKFPNQKNTPNMFSEGQQVCMTRKLHGANARYGIVKKSKVTILDRIKKLFGNKWTEWEYIYGSRQVEKGSTSQGFYSTNVWKTVGDRYNIEEKLWDLVKSMKDNKILGQIGDGIVIYGEVYGSNIQGQHYNYGKKELDLACFDIKANGDYLDYIDFENFMKGLKLPVVEELYCGDWSKEKQDELVLDQFIPGTKIPHEGIVVKCVTGDRQRVSKIINPDYLIFSEKKNVPDGH